MVTRQLKKSFWIILSRMMKCRIYSALSVETSSDILSLWNNNMNHTLASIYRTKGEQAFPSEWVYSYREKSVVNPNIIAVWARDISPWMWCFYLWKAWMAFPKKNTGYSRSKSKWKLALTDPGWVLASFIFNADWVPKLQFLKELTFIFIMDLFHTLNQI